jgi:hypothetical protein
MDKMGLFDGLGLGDGYDHSPAKRELRRHYVQSNPNRKSEKDKEMDYVIGLGTGMLMVAVAIGCIAICAPKKNYSTVIQTESGSITNYTEIKPQYQIMLEKLDDKFEAQTDKLFEKADNIGDKLLEKTDSIGNALEKIVDKI